MAKKTLVIKCTGADTIPLSELKPFQGELKTLTTENYERFKAQMLENGFTAPMSVWHDEEQGVFFTLDGHQRVRTLEQMEQEGIKIPDVPITLVHAKTHKEAKKILLGLASQYGDVDRQGLYEFMHDAGMSIEEMGNYRFADVNMTSFRSEYFGDELAGEGSGAPGGAGKTVTGSVEYEATTFEKFDHKCPRCNFEFNDK